MFLASGHAVGGAADDGASADGPGFGGTVRAVMALLLVLVPLWCWSWCWCASSAAGVAGGTQWESKRNP